MLESFDFKQIREMRKEALEKDDMEQVQRIDNDLNGSGYRTNEEIWNESSCYDDRSGL